MITRVLQPDEWPRLAERFAEEGGTLPPDGSTIVVAEDDGVIVGFLVVQFVPHVEPLWIDPAYRGKVYWPSLLQQAESLLANGEYYVFAPNAKIARMAELSGLTPLSWTIFRKDLRCHS